MFLPEDDFSRMKGRHRGTQEPAGRKEIKTVRKAGKCILVYISSQSKTQMLDQRSTFSKFSITI